MQFAYGKDGLDAVGEIYFHFCLSLLVNGEMGKQRELPYDKVMVAETGVGFDGSFNKYVFMLSGSDFQFEVISKSCSFAEDVKSGIFVEQ